MCQQVCIGELHLAAEKSKSLLCKGQPPELSGACSGGGGGVAILLGWTATQGFLTVSEMSMWPLWNSGSKRVVHLSKNIAAPMLYAMVIYLLGILLMHLLHCRVL